MKIIDSFSGSHAALSNFWMMPFDYKGKEYASSEHAFNAMKATNDADHELVRTQHLAREAKAKGRSIELRENWDKIKYPIMQSILEAKFNDPFHIACLLETKNALLVEGNTWHDNIWGDCTCGRESCKLTGENALGVLLMMTRLKLSRR